MADYVDLSPERLLDSLVPECPCAIFVNTLAHLCQSCLRRPDLPFHHCELPGIMAQ